MNGLYIAAMLWCDWLCYWLEARHPGELEEKLHREITQDPYSINPQTQKYFHYASGRACPGHTLINDAAEISEDSFEIIASPLLDLIDDTPPIRTDWLKVLESLPLRIRKHIYLLSGSDDDPFALDCEDLPTIIHAVENIRMEMSHFSLAAFLALMLEAQHRGREDLIGLLDYLGFMLFVDLCVLPPFRSISTSLWPRLNERFFQWPGAGDIDDPFPAEMTLLPRRIALHALERMRLLPDSLIAERRFLALADGKHDMDYFNPIFGMYLESDEKPPTLDDLDETLRSLLNNVGSVADELEYPGSVLPRSNDDWFSVLQRGCDTTSRVKQKNRNRLRCAEPAASARSAGLTGQEWHSERRTQMYAPDENADGADDD